MRNGPLVYRRASATRFTCGAPSPLERLQSLSALGNSRPMPRRTRAVAAASVQSGSQRVELGSRLPINLRQFLTQQMGSSMRIEDDSIVALEPRSVDALMRELARAIRRFSAERAREAWCECTAGMDLLEREFSGALAAGRGPLALCLRCASVGSGRHCGDRCVQVPLDGEIRALHSDGGCAKFTSELLHRAVENFRRLRGTAGLPHFDLDCYVTNGQVVFTWRPLPA
ncbi:MAG TPA: hypothetical protein VMU16_01375 [Candidatus Binataceae bacterium]|nr:hypothetical protein [Candidatus Binataceae bacterium]